MAAFDPAPGDGGRQKGGAARGGREEGRKGGRGGERRQPGKLIEGKGKWKIEGVKRGMEERKKGRGKEGKLGTGKLEGKEG